MMRDMMPNFELLQPTKLTDALAQLDRRGKDIWKMAGGNDSLDWFKDRVKRPKVVMDLGGIAELKYIRETADGVEIGALTTLAEVSNSPVIRAKFKVLADAAGRVASPQKSFEARLAVNGLLSRRDSSIGTRCTNGKRHGRKPTFIPHATNLLTGREHQIGHIGSINGVIDLSRSLAGFKRSSCRRPISKLMAIRRNQ